MSPLKKPDEQLEQAVSPTNAVYVPGGHDVQLFSKAPPLAVLYFPAVHAVKKLDPVLLM